jgi:hypothetical protein
MSCNNESQITPPTFEEKITGKESLTGTFLNKPLNIVQGVDNWHIAEKMGVMGKYWQPDFVSYESFIQNFKIDKGDETFIVYIRGEYMQQSLEYFKKLTSKGQKTFSKTELDSTGIYFTYHKEDIITKEEIKLHTFGNQTNSQIEVTDVQELDLTDAYKQAKFEARYKVVLKITCKMYDLQTNKYVGDAKNLRLETYLLYKKV